MSAPETTTPPAPPKKKAGLLGPLIVAVVAGGLGVGFGLSVPPAPAAGAEAHEQPAGHGAEPDGHATPAEAHEEPLADPIDLPELIVNLARSNGQRYLKVRCSVRVRTKDPGAARERLSKRQPELRDGLIALLSAKSLHDVEHAEAKEGIKLALLDLLNREAFPDQLAKAERLYFLEFIVQ